MVQAQRRQGSTAGAGGAPQGQQARAEEAWAVDARRD